MARCVRLSSFSSFGAIFRLRSLQARSAVDHCQLRACKRRRTKGVSHKDTRRRTPKKRACGRVCAQTCGNEVRRLRDRQQTAQQRGRKRITAARERLQSWLPISQGITGTAIRRGHKSQKTMAFTRGQMHCPPSQFLILTMPYQGAVGPLTSQSSVVQC